jgi:hypothetical protein
MPKIMPKIMPKCRLIAMPAAIAKQTTRGAFGRE